MPIPEVNWPDEDIRRISWESSVPPSAFSARYCFSKDSTGHGGHGKHGWLCRFGGDDCDPCRALIPVIQCDTVTQRVIHVPLIKDDLGALDWPPEPTIVH